MTAHTTRTADAELVARARRGDADAFAALARRHERALLAACRREVGGAIDAQDVAQEALVEAFVGLGRLRDPSAFGAWLLAIARNRARKLSLRRHDVLVAEADGVAGRYALWRLSDDGDPAAAVERRERLAGILGELPRERLEAVVDHLAGYTYAEIAARSGTSPSTVRGRLFLARRRLRHVLVEPASGLSTEGVHMDAFTRVGLAVYGRFRRSTDRVVVLHDVDGPRELPLRMSADDAGAIERAVAQPDLPLVPSHELALGIATILGATVEQVQLQRVGADAYGDSYCAVVTLAHLSGPHELRARTADGLALAGRTGAPVLVPADTFAADSWDPTDAEARRRHDESVRKELGERLRRGSLPEPVEAPRLPPDVQTCIEEELGLLAELPEVRTAALVHEAGGLQAWAGVGERSVLAVYAVTARGESDEDAELLSHAVYPSEHVLGGVRFETVASGWRLEAAIAHEATERETRDIESRFDAAAARLSSLLEALGEAPRSTPSG